MNADDFGLSESVTLGVIQGMQQGIVTSTSLLANAPGTKAGIGRLINIGCRTVGIHLNLTTGLPLGPRPRQLTKTDGSFSGPSRLWSLGVLGRLPAVVEAELERQIETIGSLGVAVSHLDGHHHIHILPQIAPIVAALARRHGIRAIRLPYATGRAVVGLARLKWRLINHYAGRARGIFAGAGLLMPDHFLAWYARGSGASVELMAALDLLQAGVTELAVHPGLPDDTLAAVDTYVEQRHLELAALCDPAIRRYLDQRGIALTTFADLCEGAEPAGSPG